MQTLLSYFNLIHISHLQQATKDYGHIIKMWKRRAENLEARNSELRQELRELEDKLNAAA